MQMVQKVIIEDHRHNMDLNEPVIESQAVSHMPLRPSAAPRPVKLFRIKTSEAIALNHIAHYSPGWVSANGCLYIQMTLPGQWLPPIQGEVVYLNFSIGGIPFSVCVPHTWVMSILQEAGYADVSVVPDVMRLALFDVACEKLARWLEEKLARPVQLESTEEPRNNTLRFQFLGAWRSDQGDIDFRLSCQEDGLPLLIDLLSTMYEVPRSSFWVNRLPVTLPVLLGQTRLTKREIDGLQCGDVVFIEQGQALWHDAEEDLLECALKVGYGAWRIQFEQASVMCVEWMDYMEMDESGNAPASQEDQQEPQDDQDILSDEETKEQHASLDGVLLPLSFDLGEIKLSLEELRQLTPGRVFALDRPVDQAVYLRVHDKIIGRGQLMDIDGSLGVMIQSLRFES